MPPLASSKRPARSVCASVNAPFLWPNISLSNSEEEMPPRFTLTNGPPARLLCLWMASATSSLPVPLSPVMRTGAFVGAMRATVERMPEREDPTKPPLKGEAFFAEKQSLDEVNLPGFSPFKGELERVLELVRLFAVLILSISTSAFHGFVMKSKAPARMPRTARSMLPQAVIRMIGTSGRNNFACLSNVRPSSPSVEWLKFMSISTSSTAGSSCKTRMAALGSSVSTTS